MYSLWSFWYLHGENDNGVDATGGVARTTYASETDLCLNLVHLFAVSVSLYFFVKCNIIFYIWETAFLNNLLLHLQIVSLFMNLPSRKDVLLFYHWIGCSPSWPSMGLPPPHSPLSSQSIVHSSVMLEFGCKKLWMEITKSRWASPLSSWSTSSSGRTEVSEN